MYAKLSYGESNYTIKGSSALGFQDTNYHSFIYYKSKVHGNYKSLKGENLDYKVNEGT